MYITTIMHFVYQLIIDRWFGHLSCRKNIENKYANIFYGRQISNRKMAHTSQMKKQVSIEKNFQIFSMVGRYQREILHILHKYKKKIIQKKSSLSWQFLKAPFTTRSQFKNTNKIMRTMKLTHIVVKFYNEKINVN